VIQIKIKINNALCHDNSMVVLSRRERITVTVSEGGPVILVGRSIHAAFVFGKIQVIKLMQ
jgi:hypothetical protein